jgi:hypothetical protein
MAPFCGPAFRPIIHRTMWSDRGGCRSLLCRRVLSSDPFAPRKGHSLHAIMRYEQPLACMPGRRTWLGSAVIKTLLAQHSCPRNQDRYNVRIRHAPLGAAGSAARPASNFIASELLEHIARFSNGPDSQPLQARRPFGSDEK